MFTKQTIRDIDVKGKNILVRTDYNVPLTTVHETVDELPSVLADSNQVITSDFRIRASLPTIEYLLEHQAAKIILISHLGRPQGKDEKLSLRPVAERLVELLPGQLVNFVDEVTGEQVKSAVSELPDRGIILLENLRFDPREKANDQTLAQELVDCTGAEVFVQDGFAVTHREQASTAAITKLLPSVAGLLLEKEVTTLKGLIDDPVKPFAVVIGGAKVEDKQPLVDEFSPLADQIIVGGKIAADGYQSENPKIYVAEDFDEDSSGAKLDVGPISTMKMLELLEPAQTVLWNGVLGKVEDAAYATSSTILAKFLGNSPHVTSVICGGDTSGFVEECCAADPTLQFSLISTGGGAALELLSGRTLPGITNLRDK